MVNYSKDPNASLPYVVDWTAWLGTDTISTSQWIIEGPDAVLTKSNEEILTGNKKTSVVLAGGTLSLSYYVTNRITTALGYVDDRTFSVTVNQA